MFRTRDGNQFKTELNFVEIGKQEYDERVYCVIKWLLEMSSGHDKTLNKFESFKEAS